MKFSRGRTHIKRAFASQLGLLFKDKATAFVTVCLFALLSFLAGWLPDGCTALFLDGEREKGFIMLGVSLFSLFLLWIGGVWFAKEVEFDVFEEKPEKRKVLILFLSKNRISKEDFEKALEKVREEEKEEEILKSINNWVKSWRMPLEAIKHHLPKLERIVVITSLESSNQLEQFKLLVGEIFGKDTAEKISEEKVESFESIKGLFKKLDEIYDKLEREGFRSKDAIIDVTGGQKPVSIAGALITFAYTDREFQYVSTNTYKVKSYDVRVVSNDKI